jgi:hypothetical protein
MALSLALFGSTGTPTRPRPPPPGSQEPRPQPGPRRGDDPAGLRTHVLPLDCADHALRVLAGEAEGEQPISVSISPVKRLPASSSSSKTRPTTPSPPSPVTNSKPPAAPSEPARPGSKAAAGHREGGVVAAHAHSAPGCAGKRPGRATHAAPSRHADSFDPERPANAPHSGPTTRHLGRGPTPNWSTDPYEVAIRGSTHLRPLSAKAPTTRAHSGRSIC